ncbi:uncharacterized protein Dwil_GK12659 [Drosophila willistoni]|uniref:DUF4604 domain-containing protein n=1 Tax=Drosophila willistoni TaxID=7260 RepID=B4N393_DROWI|nr:uncharacterized protein KIAA1143 homolog [Drosophila willistoni]EDW78832.1 uncharacterized protein Dwil_GK12659 [Drosophila willistoni]
MSKRNNITYVKPQEPSFLAKLKAEIGYKEGPTVDTKRQKLEQDPDYDDLGEEENERPEREDEQPQIVVLQSGDLTAEEVAIEQQRIAKEEAEKPADLNQPIVFKQRHKPTKDQELSSSSSSPTPASTSKSTTTDSNKKRSKKSSKPAAAATNKLSFNEDEEDNEAESD